MKIGHFAAALNGGRGITRLIITTSLALTLAMTGHEAKAQVDEAYLEALEYRNLGPFRGGRVTSVAGVTGNTLTYYMGAEGGGVWKTTNAGVSWDNISDDFFTSGSIGAIDVSDSDANVIYVGTGTSDIRGVSAGQGDGMYKSTDGGQTWIHIGLRDSRHIASIQIHPTNPDLVYVAVQGAAYAPTDERGIYRSSDGGTTWEKILFVDEVTGGADLKMDATNSRILYATLWDHQRKPWEIRSGGPGSGIYKSTDGGDNWEELTEGLPEGMGKIGVAPSPANPSIVWAIVEAKEKGGLYRSDDGGENWTLVNGDRRLHARSWYYMHVDADPVDENTVYVMNSGFYRSIDGGKSVSVIRGPHGDYHDLWINPDNAKNMVQANDGGGTVTFDSGQTWSPINNQPTAQFYRVNVDNMFPYRVYAGQQDNSTVAISSRGLDGGIGREDYFSVGGCESAFVSFDPDNPRYVYAGCYLGQINEWDRETTFTRDIRVYPEIAFGVDPKDRKYRFNWNAPIIVSEHDPSVIYHGGNVLLKSTDRGNSWVEISPDLTRDEEDKQGPMGGPITNEISENYNTLSYVEESPHSADVIWAGSDDGLVHVTLDGGESWTDVTPRRAGDGIVNAIEVSPHDPDTVYLAFNKFRYNDHTPFIYKTTNNGRRWTNIAEGLPENAFVRVVREDPVRPGLLYAGTEIGIFISFDDGDNWQPLKLNLPAVPVTDIFIKDNDLVLSTQGRAFWIMDDITPLRQLDEAALSANVHLFEPKPGYAFIGGGFGRSSTEAPNPDNGAWIYYALADEPDLEGTSLTMEILNSDGDLVRIFEAGEDDELTTDKGLNRIAWNIVGENSPHVAGLLARASGGDDTVVGFRQPPGDYTVRLSLGDETVETALVITQDPRSKVSDDAILVQYTITVEAFGMVQELNRTMLAFRDVKEQVELVKTRSEKVELPEAVLEAVETLLEALDAWDKGIVSSKREFFQDVLNWPDLLFTDIQNIYATISGATPPLTAGMHERYQVVKTDFATAMADRDAIVNGPLAAFNDAYANAGLPAALLPSFSNDGD